MTGWPRWAMMGWPRWLAAIVVGVPLLPVAPVAEESPLAFEDVTDRAGVVFLHENGATPQKYLPETMGGGAVIFDYNRDGWPDIFLVNSGSLTDAAVDASARHGLFRNRGDGTFEDRSASSGLGAQGYGMGACAADYDGDGWIDLYVTNFGPNVLYRGSESGRFRDVTDRAGVGSDAWSASCAFGDIDNDGDVDLYVANYVDFTVIDNKYCGDYTRNVRTYCHPNVYRPEPDVLFRNNGDGTFTDVSEVSGIRQPGGFGLGVVFSDIDGDGWIDIYVANDSVPNFLFRNRGGGVFEEIGLFAGVAVGTDGQPLAGMGTDAGDIDGDGRPDLFVSNLDRQTHNLYRNLGGGLFADITLSSGVGGATLPFVGFGAAFADFDNDTDLDLAIANGDILDNVRYFRDTGSYPQRNLLLRNDGNGRFVDADAGADFARRAVSRALAVGDLDNDGRVDLVVANNGEPAEVLLNRSGAGHALVIALRGQGGLHPDGIGAELRLSAGGRTLVRSVRGGSGYLGQNDLRVHFGLADAVRAERLEVRWPGGAVEIFEDIAANQILTVREGLGIVGRRPMTRP